MVVVSGGWAKSVIYPNCGDVIVSPKMAAKAVLICRPNSHPFQERSLTLDQPVKIGRSVARARAAPNNAIFDCKVLSRNHALLWYENGKFYLQDTKSSNGTFVNNQRLSKGAEESPPREVCSGDIVQFGVDVMENSRKVTHGCIVATLKLYLPDGKEAKASPSTSVVSSVGVVPLEDLYTLNQYLQEALQREQQLEGKIATLQQLLDTTREASETSWKALIDEDRLLSRVEILENQLQMYSKNFAEDKLREELCKLQEDKSQYQGAAKESIRKILQEKLDAVQKLQDLERSLSNTEGDCSHLKEANERSQQDLQELALKYSLQQQKTEELASKLQETEDQHREVRERLEQEKQELQARLQEQLDAERALQLRLETLQADGDMAQRQLAVLQSHLQSLQPNEDVDTKIDIDVIKSTNSTGLDVDVILERIEPEKVSAVDDTQDEVEILRALVEKSEEDLRKMHARMETLSQKLEESQTEEDLNSEQMCELQQKLDDLELDLELKFVQSEDESVEAEADHSSVSSSGSQAKQLKADIAKLEELLAESRGKKQDAETERQLYQRELENAKIKVKSSIEELNVLTQRLQTAQNEMLEKTESVTKLHEQMQWLETSADEVKFQVLQLQERLQDEQERSRRLAGEAETLRTQLMEAQQSAKQSRNEAERMRDRLRAVQDELHLATTSDDNRSQEEISLILQRCDDLEEINSRLKIDLQLLEEANLSLRTDLAAQLNQLGTEYGTSSELIECRLQRDKISRELSSLQEEMVFMKQCYSQCSDMNTQLSQEMVTLQEEYTNIIQNSAYGMYRYLLPLLVGFIAVCFGLQMYIFK